MQHPVEVQHTNFRQKAAPEIPISAALASSTPPDGRPRVSTRPSPSIDWSSSSRGGGRFRLEIRNPSSIEALCRIMTLRCRHRPRSHRGTNGLVGPNARRHLHWSEIRCLYALHYAKARQNGSFLCLRTLLYLLKPRKHARICVYLPPPSTHMPLPLAGWESRFPTIYPRHARVRPTDLPPNRRQNHTSITKQQTHHR